VCRTQTDPQLVGKLSLREVRVTGKKAHHLELGILAQTLALQAHAPCTLRRLPHGVSLQARRSGKAKTEQAASDSMTFNFEQ
jgi:hypothetical protein